MLVRMHPSQNGQLHRTWLETAPDHVHMANDVPLYPLLNAVDVVASYSSTVLVESALMEKPLVQLRYFPEDNLVPLAECGMAWPVNKPEKLAGVLEKALGDKKEWQAIKLTTQSLMPSQKAAPMVAETIRKLLKC